jgi:DNA-binding transcriptional LysR family regulator
MAMTDRFARRFKLRDLHTFFAVARRGSMAKAAGDLALTQPAISKALADLEATLGVRLLDRTPRGVELTAYGATLHKWGAAVFDGLEHAVAEIRFLSDPSVGEIRLGCNDPLGASLVPLVIDELTKEYPRLVFDVRQGQTQSLHRDLRERTVELIVGRLPQVPQEDFHVEKLFDDPLAVAVGERNPLVRRRSLKLGDLMEEPWTMPHPFVIPGSPIVEIFREARLDLPRMLVLCDSVQMQAALLAAGRYVSFFPASLVRFAGKRYAIKVLPIELKRQPPPVGVITLNNRSLSPMSRLFIDRVQRVVGRTREQVLL